MLSDTGLIIFSRFNSKRLYGKALIDICNRPLLGRVIDIAKQLKKYPIIVATTKKRSDDAIETFASNENVKVFRGSENNVLKRALDCCNCFGLKRFARICGDRPFYSSKLIEKLINLHVKFNLDLATNSLFKTFPYGLTAEVLSVECLKIIKSETSRSSDLEHITRYIYNNEQKFKIKNISSAIKNIENLNFAVDIENDIKKSEWILSKISPTKTNNLGDLVKYLKKYENRS
jgi:spore coat polysaccharide biosynthesis protein SpsF